MRQPIDNATLNKIVLDLSNRHRNIMGILGELATNFSHHSGGKIRLNSKVWNVIKDSLDTNLGLLIVIGTNDSRAEWRERLTNDIKVFINQDFVAQRVLFGTLYEIPEDIFCKKYLDFVIRTQGAFGKEYAPKAEELGVKVLSEDQFVKLISK